MRIIHALKREIYTDTVVQKKITKNGEADRLSHMPESDGRM